VRIAQRLELPVAELAVKVDGRRRPGQDLPVPCWGLGRGSEYRAAVAALDQRGGEILTFEDFLGVYTQELAEGKFWGVEHDLRAMGGAGMAVPAEGPCELRFDYVYYSVQSLALQGMQASLTEEERGRIWSEPWEVLPNSWHPSDHLPVAAAFTFR